MREMQVSRIIIVLLILCAYCIADNASASGTWEEIHHVSGADWEDVFFLDESHGWAVGWNGSVMATEDGGKKWLVRNRVPSGPFSPHYYASFFVSEDEGWIVGSIFTDGVIFLTEDGGRTVEERMGFPRAWLFDVYFISQNEGWVVGSKWNEGTKNHDIFIVHTEDAGKSWEVQSQVERGGLNKVYFIDENKGFAVGATSGVGSPGGADAPFATDNNISLVLGTDDGGKTWNKYSIPVDKGICKDVFFLNSLEGWIASSSLSGSSLLKTVDGGASWEKTDFPQDTYLVSVWFKDSEQGILIGVDRSNPIYSGLIMKTDDGGKTFDRQSGFPMLNAMANFGHESWGVGYGNTILHSQDGRNWEPQVEKTYDYMDIDFVRRDVGFLLGRSTPGWGPWGDTVILSTDDAGSNWQEAGVHAEWLYCLDFIDSSSGWMGGVFGLYGTEDTGKTMQKIEGAFSDIFDIVFPTKRRGWLSGGRWLSGVRVLWHTLDGGETWQEADIDLKGKEITDIDALGKNAWAVGYEAGIGGGGFVFITEDGGRNFRKVKTTERLYNVSFATEDAGWATGDPGVILVTDDGGTNWDIQKSGTDKYLSDILFLSEEEGWAVGEDGIILHTINGGKTWTEQESPSKESLSKIVYTGRDSLIAVGRWNTILKYTDKSLSQYSERFAVSDIKSQPITWGQVKNRLHQNYPNPFNPETWIPFSISEPASVSIKIHNVSGKLVREINLGHKEPGSYLSKNKAAYWDGRNQAGEPVSSGIYYYSIKGEFPETRKMMLMK